MRLHLVCNTCDFLATPSNGVGWNLLIGKIDRGLDPCGGADQFATPVLVKLAETALQLTNRLTSLGFGLGFDQVREGLRLGEIEASILDGSPRELAGLGQSQAGQRAQFIQQPRDNRWPSMRLELNDVLAGVGAGPGKPQDKRGVD
jgi:hypothetical protein